jgi:adenylate cyclase
MAAPRFAQRIGIGRVPLAFLVLALLLGSRALLPIWADLSGRAFDFLSTIAPPAPEASDVVIVAVDEPSFAEIGLQWPWPRDLHAQLIRSLRAAGAKAIAVDIVLAEPSEPAADSALAAALGRDVVLAADETVAETPQGTLLTRTEPFPALMARGTRSGIASLTQDKDGVVRRMPAYPDGFMRVLLGKDAGSAGPSRDLIQYFGPAGSYPRVSYYQALDPEAFLPPGALKGRTVIVGYALQATPEAGQGATPDSFETPWTLRTGGLTPGVEVQATIYDNMRHGLSIRALPDWAAYLALALGAALGLAASRPQSTLRKAALAIGAILATVLLSWLTLRFGRTFWSPVEPAAAIALVAVAIGARDFAAEQRVRRQVQDAFSQYLSPAMVERLVADPSLLNLGGEAKEMTILFADIRGFTSISEAMKDDPAGLTGLINAILTPLTDIVLAHGGTIDKYMGDCVMAFWNAPLEDRDHSVHAVEAATAMAAAMPAINDTVRARLPERLAEHRIAIGVGVNSGVCVVGNMGSEQRFDYSVLGDAVNVASRIEGLTKTYGVPILIGEATAALVGERLALKQVGREAVRGKKEEVALFTPARDRTD